MTTIMDFLSGFIAASSAGKLPTTRQANDLSNWLLKSPLFQLEATVAGSGGKLSDHGQQVLRDLRGIVEAYQAAAVEKNGDDILQDALYALRQAGTKQYYATRRDKTDESPAVRDANDFVGALRVCFEVLTGSVRWREEAASFARLTVADVAEAVEQTAGDVKDQLRESDRRAKEEREGSTAEDQMDVDNDARAQFEQRVDSIKVVGGNAIGTGQTIKSHSQSIGDEAVFRLDEITYRIAERAQNDPEYRRAVDTLFSIYDKYKQRSIDRAQSVQNGQDLEDELAYIIGDETNGQAPDAIKKLRTLVERFAGGKSLQDLFSAAATCGADLREDPDVRSNVDAWEVFVRKSMDEPGYIESDEYRQRRSELQSQWNQLQSRDSDAGRKWNLDLERLQREANAFGDAIKQDGSLNRLKEAHIALAKHVAGAVPTAGRFLSGQASWVWSDVVDVLLPRVFSIIKEIPFPRTEYVDAETEFVLENLSLESLQLLPGHIMITNQTEIDINAPGPAAGESTKDTSTKTRVKFTGVQLKLKQVSFYYRDKSSANGRTVTGLLDVTIPQKGVDLDVQFALLPTESGAKERQKREAFHRIEHVSVDLDDVTMNLSKTNHPVTLTIFKPIVRTRLIQALKNTLERYVRFSLEALDGLAWEVHSRAQVFADAGAPTPIGAHILGLTSVFGRMAREGRFFAGMQATSVGFVKDDPETDTAFAVGTEPQLLHENKHGPGVRQNQANSGAANVSSGATGQLKASKAKIQGEGVPQEIEGFADSVARKREAEKNRDGWRSNSFDLPAVAK